MKLIQGRLILTAGLACLLLFSSFYGNYLSIVHKDFFGRFQHESEALVIGRLVADEQGLGMPARSNLGFAAIGRFSYEPRYLTQGYALLGHHRIADKKLSTLSITDGNWVRGVSRVGAAVLVAYDPTLEQYIGRHFVMADGDSRTVQAIEHVYPGTTILLRGEALSVPNAEEKDGISFEISGEIVEKSEYFLHPYVSQYGIQGPLFSWLYRLADHRLSPLYAVNAGLLVLAIAWLCAMYKRMFGYRFAIVFLVVAGLSPWITAFARNLYWIPFSWFLPAAFAATLQLLSKGWARVGCWLFLYAAFVFKCLAGYEYISSVILLAGAPFLYAFLSATDRPSRIIGLKIFLAIQVVGVAGFLTALLFHAQIRGDTLWNGLVQIYEADVKRRTYAEPSSFGEGLSASLAANPLSVLKTYVFEWQTQLIKFVPGKAFFWISLFATIIAAYQFLVAGVRREIALLVAFLLPAVSWFILAKAHSYVHVHMNYVLWYFGFVPAVFSVLLGVGEKIIPKALQWVKVGGLRMNGSSTTSLQGPASHEQNRSGALVNGKTKGPEKLSPLTAMRFFAAAMIVIGHAHPLFGSFGIATTIPLNQGVSFFFVLSGFILAYNYPALSSDGERKRFWISRVARIWPLHVVTCLIWIVVVFELDRKTNFPGAGGILKLLTNLMLVQVWIPLHSWVLSFNGVSWSIAAELFFYACFPFLIANWRRHWHALILGQLLVVALALWGATHWQLPLEGGQSVGMGNILYFNPVVRLVEFTMGVAVAWAVVRLMKRPLVLGRAQWFALEIFTILAAILALLAVADLPRVRDVLGTAVSYYLANQGAGLFFAAVIGVFALSKGPTAQILSNRPLVFLGEISFALYLCHAIVIHYLQPYAPQLALTGVLGYGLFWSALLVISALLFWGVENPARALIVRRYAQHAAGERDASRRPLHFSRTTASIAALVLVVLMAVFLKPSTIQPLSEADAADFLASRETERLDPGVTFNGRYTVLGVRYKPVVGGTTRIEIMLGAAQDMVVAEKLALHLNNEKGEIFGQPGDVVMDPSRGKISANTRWLQVFSVPTEQLETSRSIAFAIYKDPAALFVATGGNSDWDGRRLIFQRNQ